MQTERVGWLVVRHSTSSTERADIRTPSESSRVEQDGRLEPESLGEPKDVDERDVLLSPFDLPHVGAMEVTQLGEVLLAEGKALPTATDRVAKFSEFGFALGWHLRTESVSKMVLFDLQP